MIKVNIYYITKGITIPTSHLKFGSEAMVFDPHFIILVMNDSLDESLNSKLEISGGKKNISSDVFMNAGVLLKKCLNVFSVNPTLLTSSVVDVCNFVITQKCSEVLRVPDDLTFYNIAVLFIHFHFTFCPHMTE